MTKITNTAFAAGTVAAALLSWAAPAGADTGVDGNWNQTTVGACEQPAVQMPADVAYSVQCEHHSVVEHSVG
ncbi:hypothetical protein [Streptodolium elevatio]